MSDRAWRILDWLMPVLVMASASIPPEYVAAIKAHGWLWAIGYGAAVVASRAIYQAYTEGRARRGR